MRIAVVFSAESRTFNTKTAVYWLKWKNLVETISEDRIEIVFYGHTWDHCPEEDIPNTKILPLKYIWVESENIISDWVCGLYSERVYRTSPTANVVDSYLGKIDPSNDASKIKYIDETLFHSRRHWGQHVGAFLSFSKIPKEEYDNIDGFIKVRWDSIPVYAYGIKDFDNNDPSACEFKNSVLVMENYFKFNQCTYSSDITKIVLIQYQNRYVNNVMPNDVIIYLTKSAMNKFINNVTAEEFLNATIGKFNSHGMAGHTMWEAVMASKNINYRAIDDRNNLFKAKIIRPDNYSPKIYNYY